MRTPLSLDKSARVILLSLSALFVLVLILESIQDYPLIATGPTPQDQNRREQIENRSAANLPLTEYAVMVERPLFMPDRRPFVPEEVNTGPDPALETEPEIRRPDEDFSLSAIIITDEKRLALIQSGPEMNLKRIAQGEALNGWILRDIQPGNILLERNGETKQLELKIKGSP